MEDVDWQGLGEMSLGSAERTYHPAGPSLRRSRSRVEEVGSVMGLLLRVLVEGPEAREERVLSGREGTGS
ncbi:hypothetical protein JCGZ_01690 [Jatropha curcas]|uniref:Uncharacterized protein n=1 Tax=Jatropha curcas TaxID=180498 RepID=A0A067JU15_JATCU|nr:hypothetical protein JCGZ_01690 [Jatropha curcas]